MTAKKKKTELKKRGRKPIQFKDEYCDLLIKHMSEGLSFESFSAVIGVSRTILYEWAGSKDLIPKQPKFADAKKKGIDASLLYWEKEGISGMWGGKKFNPSIWIFNMRNRFGWRDQSILDDVKDDDEKKDVTIQIAYKRNG